MFCRWKTMILFLLLLCITGRQPLPVIAETGEKLSSVEVVHGEEETAEEKQNRNPRRFCRIMMIFL